MATAPAKSPLHNFPLTFLRWGSNSRCRRPASGASESPEQDLPGRRSRAARNRHAKESGGEGEGEAEAEDSALAAEQKPWNLRPRKALFSKAKNGGGGGGAGESGEAKSTRSQQQSASLEKTEIMAPVKEKKRKFLIELSKEEIEEDVFIMTGSRPVRRPRKRPKNVQKQLDVSLAKHLSLSLWFVCNLL